MLKIFGFHIIECPKEPELEDGIPVLRAGSRIKLRLFGRGFSNGTTVGFTAESLKFGDKCHKIISETYRVIIPIIK